MKPGDWGDCFGRRFEDGVLWSPGALGLVIPHAQEGRRIKCDGGDVVRGQSGTRDAASAEKRRHKKRKARRREEF
jgi:hypothetical protein